MPIPENQLPDGGKFVSLMHWLHFPPPPKDLLLLISVIGGVNPRLEGLDKLKKFNDLNGNQTVA
jgi:hypothetical protein